jgi:hypothetical protein
MVRRMEGGWGWEGRPLGASAQAWNAAVGRSQAWAWWASGSVLGVAVLTLLALSEKRRDGVLRVLDALRRRR